MLGVPWLVDASLQPLPPYSHDILHASVTLCLPDVASKYSLVTVILIQGTIYLVVINTNSVYKLSLILTKHYYIVDVIVLSLKRRKWKLGNVK